MKNISLVFAAVMLPSDEPMTARDHLTLIPMALTGQPDKVVSCAHDFIQACANGHVLGESTMRQWEEGGVVFDRRFVTLVEGRVGLDPGLDVVTARTLRSRKGHTTSPELIAACRELLEAVEVAPEAR